MDELRMIREAYGEPTPPTMRETTEARALMFEEPAPRRARFGWRLKAGVGVVAVGAAAAVAVSAVGPGAPAAPGESPVQVDGEQAVLAAAEKAAAQPTGKYWFSDQVSGLSYIMRPKTGAYAITGAHSETFRWVGAKSGMGEGVYGRDVPARPLTPRDEELWRKAGSPSQFRVWSNDHYQTYDRSKTGWQADPPNAAGGGKFFIGGTGRSLTTEEILNLPSDPKRLAELFIDPVQDPWMQKMERLKELGVNTQTERPSSLGLCSSSAERASKTKVSRTGTLLMDAPIQPEVRAGLMRALARQPGIESIGKTVDVLGREGVALASRSYTTCLDGEHGRPAEEQGRYRSRNVLVFDRKTGEALASQTVLTKPGGKYKDREPGFVISYRAARDSGWTDTKPKPPAELPF